MRIGDSIRVGDVTPTNYEILNSDTAVIVTVKKARGAVEDDEEDDEEGTDVEGAEATTEAAAEE